MDDENRRTWVLPAAIAWVAAVVVARELLDPPLDILRVLLTLSLASLTAWAIIRIVAKAARSIRPR